MTRSTSFAVVLAVVLLALVRLEAHDIATDVTVHAFVKPEGTRLRVLVRAPLRALLDVEFPKRSNGSIDLARADSSLQQAANVWIARNLAVYEGGERLPSPDIVSARVTIPSDRSFTSYEQALAHVTGPRHGASTELYWENTLLDVLLEYPIRSEQSDFSIEPALAKLGLSVTTVLRFLPPAGSVRAFEYSGDPGLVRLDPRWHQAARTFVRLGFNHILTGIDHLLFLLCLVIPLRRVRPLVVVVTAFTVAHSITLIAAATHAVPGASWFAPLVETLIAASIVYMAMENIVSGATVTRRWMIAFAFGLVHGFGFSFALREMLQFAGSHLTMSLVAFNAGVELGQLFVLALMLPALQILFYSGVPERIGTIVLSAFVAHTGWHWTVERADRLRQFPWPSLDSATLARAMRWTMALLVLGALVWLVRSAVPRLRALRRV
jgi:HupE / UreJ protein